MDPERAMIMMGWVVLRTYPNLTNSLHYKCWCQDLIESKDYLSDILRLHIEIKPYTETEFLENYDQTVVTERGYAAIHRYYQKDILKSNALRSLIGNVESLPYAVSINGVKAKDNLLTDPANRMTAQEFEFPIAYCNDMYTRITGYKRHEIIGKDFMFLQNEPIIERELIYRLKSGLNQAQATNIVITNYTKYNEAFKHLIIIRPIFDYDGCYAYVIALHFDISIADSVKISSKLAIDVLTQLPKFLDL